MKIKINAKDTAAKTLAVTQSRAPSLLIILIVLKAIGILKWNWLLVITFPILLPFIFLAVFFTVIGVVLGLVFLGAIFLDFLSSRRRYNFKKRRK